jgi:hypothetical protein
MFAEVDAYESVLSWLRCLPLSFEFSCMAVVFTSRDKGPRMRGRDIEDAVQRDLESHEHSCVISKSSMFAAQSRKVG